MDSIAEIIIRCTPHAILAMDTNLAILQVNDAFCQLFGQPSSSELTGKPASSIVDVTPFYTLMEGESRVVSTCRHLMPYDRYVDESIIYAREEGLVISIMKDVTEREKEIISTEKLRMETARVTDKVIERQMRVVQEIASLLGETTAETKIALTRLKETIRR